MSARPALKRTGEYSPPILTRFQPRFTAICEAGSILWVIALMNCLKFVLNYGARQIVSAKVDLQQK